MEMEIMEMDNEFLDYIVDPYNTRDDVGTDNMGSVRRYLRDFENPVEFYSDRQFKDRYRLEKTTVMHILIPLLFPNYALVNNRGLPIPPVIQVAIALRFYATGNYQVNASFLLDIYCKIMFYFCETKILHFVMLKLVIYIMSVLI